MASNEYEGPDLASILKTLAGLAPQNQAQNQAPTPTPPTDLEEGEYEPAPAQPVAQYQPPPPLQQLQQAAQQPWQQYQNQSSSYSQSQAPPPHQLRGPDSTTIIEWSAGLRHVMKVIARHEEVLEGIRKMIKEQHTNEEQWWASRQDRVEKQSKYAEHQAKINDILRNSGGIPQDARDGSSPEEQARELEEFDMKVHRAQGQMIQEYTNKLKHYGVPFFGTRPELVVPFKKGAGPNDRAEDGKGRIEEVELVKLQRRMLALLEEMASD